MKRIIVVFLSVLMLSYGYDAEAQRRKCKRRSPGRQVSKDVDGLSPKSSAGSIDFGATRPEFGGFYGLRFHRQFGIRESLNRVRISSHDFASGRNDDSSELRYAGNVSFRNDLIEFQREVQFSY